MLNRWWVGAVVLTLLGGTIAHAEDDEKSGSRQGQITISGGPITITATADVQGAATVGVAETDDYWLGVAVGQPSEALRSQLNLAKDEGLMVESVVPESPAAKAGLQRFDLLMKVNGKAPKEPHDLVAAVNAAKEGKLTLDLVRGGKHQTISVSPAKRPAGLFGMHHPPMPPGADADAIRLWAQRMAPGTSSGQPLQFQFIHPGQILPPGVSASVGMMATTVNDLPDGYRLQIVREMGKPAQVTVTKDKEKWEATENDLSKLPEKVRPEVEKMLHAGPMGVFSGAFSGSGGFGGSAGQVQALPMPMAPGFHGGLLHPRLDEMAREIEQLRSSVNELRSKAGLPSLPEKNPAPQVKPKSTPKPPAPGKTPEKAKPETGAKV